MRRVTLSLISLGVFSFAVLGHADNTVAGSARMRTEFRNNSDLTDSAADSTASTHTRLRLDYGFKPNDFVSIFVQPQFTKVWGESQYVPTGAAANTSTTTSGSTYDTGLSVHQAFVTYTAIENLSFTIGRRELNYGDQLLVGGLGWSPVGRSFDLASANYKVNFGNVEVFSAKVKDMNVSAAGPGDKDFSGLYVSSKAGESIQNADVYAFDSNDSTGALQAHTGAYGLRLKSPIGPLDYRVEYTYENVKAAGRVSDENQFDAEVGYTVVASKKLRMAGEYFAASDDFDQLYPTGHKWLGYADLFSRRNISGVRLGVSAVPIENLTVALDFHHFNRTNASAPAYKLNGTAYGTAETAEYIGREWDLVASYKFQGELKLELGAAQFEPGQYLRGSLGQDAASFYYLQAGLDF